MVATSQDSVQLEANCLCNKYSFVATVPSSSLPLSVDCCHCTSCRRVTGSLFLADTTWPGPANSIDLSELESYSFSQYVTIHFCGTCSTPLFTRDTRLPEDRQLTVFTGVLQKLTNLIQYVSHAHVADTIDGGASMWLRNPGPTGILAPRWKGKREESEKLPAEWPGTSMLPEALSDPSPVRVSIRCHCGGVRSKLQPLDSEFRKKSPTELPWFVDPRSLKCSASLCACNSCRLFSGNDISCWTFAFFSQVSYSIDYGQPRTRFRESVSELKAAALSTEKHPSISTLKFYNSSEDVERYFCSKCSASMLYAVHDRADLVDIAMGVVDSPHGARAEGLTSWAFGFVGMKGDEKGGYREELVNSIEKEGEAWRVQRAYPKDWRLIAREEAEARAKGDFTEISQDQS
jgi:hypothetical protein